MRSLRFASSLVLGVALAAGPAFAGGGCEDSDPAAIVQHIFEMADRDGDGRLSAAEYAAARLERYGVSFVESDADGDGATTLVEYMDLYRRIHARSGEVEI